MEMHKFTVVLMWNELRPHLLPSRFTQCCEVGWEKLSQPQQHAAAAQASKAQKKFKRETSAGLTELDARLFSSGYAPACSTTTAVPFSVWHLCPTAPVWTGSASAATATGSTGGKDWIWAPREKPRGASTISGCRHQGIPCYVLKTV